MLKETESWLFPAYTCWLLSTWSLPMNSRFINSMQSLTAALFVDITASSHLLNKSWLFNHITKVPSTACRRILNLQSFLQNFARHGQWGDRAAAYSVTKNSKIRSLTSKLIDESHNPSIWQPAVLAGSRTLTIFLRISVLWSFHEMRDQVSRCFRTCSVDEGISRKLFPEMTRLF